MIILAITILLFSLYGVLILYFWQSWKKAAAYIVGEKKPAVKVSIIIAARNEEKNIGKLLTSLQQQDYPADLLEVIVVDDHSTDATAEIVKQYSFALLIRLKEDTINSYKKKAIEAGVHKASGELIITTDADCIAGKNWIKTIAGLHEATNAVFIAAPVCFSSEKDKTVLHQFQVLDFLVLQGITGAAVSKNIFSMCNGANLAYTKKAFNDVNGFSGIDHIASGDDMLLMHKINKQFPGRVQYLKSKDAIVYTEIEKTWKSFFNQRIRWASKADKYDDKHIFYVLLLVYLFNFSFLVLLVAGFWNYQYWIAFAALWIAKTIVEFPFVNSVASFFGRQSLMNYFFFLQPIHIFYTIIAGWLGKFGSYEWKGRRVK